MSFLTRNLRQQATYWPPGVPDGFGGTTFLARSTLKVRWEDKSELFVDAQGNEAVTSSIVYSAVDVLKKGWLFLGVSSSTDPTTLAGASEIRDFEKTPTLSGLLFERKIIL